MKANSFVFSGGWQSVLRAKSVAFILLLFFAISGFAIIYFPARQEQHAIEVIGEKTKSIADMNAFALGPAMYSKNSDDIEKALLAASHRGDLIYVSVMDISGRLVASLNNNPDYNIKITETSNDPISKKDHVYNVMSPVIVDDEEIGRVYMGFSLEELRQEISRSRAFIALIMCLILVIGIVALLSISKMIKSPFDKAAGAIEQTSPDQITDQTTEQLKQEIILRKEMEANLLTAMEVADETVAAKVEFLSNISHQLRTPMTTVISSTELLLKTRIDSEQKELLDILKASSASMLLLINNLLDMARILAQELILETTIFRLRGTIENCLNAFASDAAKKGIRLLYEIHSSVPDWLIGDDFRLLQILNNLISNAIKFTEQGEVKLSVIKENGESKGSDLDSDQIRLHFAVSDTGIGLPPGKTDQIFDSLYQSGDSTVHDSRGTGLGLAITKKLIELMDGCVWVDSEKGKGSIFHFLANFKRSESIEEKRDLVSPIDEQLSDENLSLRNRLFRDGASPLGEDQKIKVLLAEDKPERQELISRMLKQHGYMVEVANNDVEAVEALKRNKFDVVLIDIQMPELDGRGTLNIIRQNEKQSGGRVPIIALMTQSRIADREQSYGMQMDDYVGMPVQPEELCSVIENVLDPSKTK